jgi:hypothetical protein
MAETLHELISTDHQMTLQMIDEEPEISREKIRKT